MGPVELVCFGTESDKLCRSAHKKRIASPCADLLSELAKDLGKPDDQKKFAEISREYTKLWNPENQLFREPLNTPFITHEQIMAGGTLKLKLGETPNRSWGGAVKSIHCPQERSM